MKVAWRFSPAVVGAVAEASGGPSHGFLMRSCNAALTLSSFTGLIPFLRKRCSSSGNTSDHFREEVDCNHVLVCDVYLGARRPTEMHCVNRSAMDAHLSHHRVCCQCSRPTRNVHFPVLQLEYLRPEGWGVTLFHFQLLEAFRSPFHTFFTKSRLGQVQQLFPFPSPDYGA